MQIITQNNARIKTLLSDMSHINLRKLKRRPVASDKLARKVDRFNGLTEEDVQMYTLPDYLAENLDLIFVGINPSLTAAYCSRYYAGPGNHFYPLLYESKLVPRLYTFDEDYKLLECGIGLTNIVDRATRTSANLKRSELKEGSKVVEEKLKRYQPKVAVFNGKCIYEAFADVSGSSFNFGLQPKYIGKTMLWVVPSTSARCAFFPRMRDKLCYFTALKKFLAYLKGEIRVVDMKEFIFEGKCKPAIPTTSKMWRRKPASEFGGKICNKETLAMSDSFDSVSYAYSTEFIVTELKPKKEETRDKEDPKDGKDYAIECPEVTPADSRYFKGSFEAVATKTRRSKVSKTKTKEERKNAAKPSSKAPPSWKPVNRETVDYIALIKRRIAEKADETAGADKET